MLLSLGKNRGSTPLKRKASIIAAEAVIVALSGVCAFLLRFEFTIPRFYWRHVVVALLCWLTAKLGAFHWYRLERLALRYFSLSDLLQLARANVAGSAIATLCILASAPAGFPRSVYFLDLILCVLMTSIGFLATRLSGELKPRKEAPGTQPALIYGAGRAGVMLLSELRQNPGLGYSVRGFIDDDRRNRDVDVQGIRVLGSGLELSEIAERTGVKEVLIAIPSASEDEMVRVLQYCQHAHVRFRTVAGLGEAVEGKLSGARIRDVDVRDLLSRQPVDLDRSLIREKIQGKVVMVTGAAGSIGSELCRQVAHFRPAAIVAFEAAETPLFHLGQEMKADFPEVPFLGEIGNIQNSGQIRAAIDTHRPSIIYHAAAYKHVPIMETHIIEAVTNNVCGTYNVARAAQEFKVEEFVLISSDKAVRPTSVMGATKRLCELLILGMPNTTTKHVAVRFGNVLGSNGSVIPTFKRQIEKGGPVTVTHPEMQRYFMTIPEAAQLVLQASAMGRGGEIFVLDMGSQVKIVDIARKLILLSGLVPEVDIQIQFTGIRPGEKLYEELSLEEEETEPTPHRKIKSLLSSSLMDHNAVDKIEHMQELCEDRNIAALVNLICELVPEYGPSEQALALAAPGRKAAASKPMAIAHAVGT